MRIPGTVPSDAVPSDEKEPREARLGTSFHRNVSDGPRQALDVVLVAAPRLAVDIAKDTDGGTTVAGGDPSLRREDCGTISPGTPPGDDPNEASCGSTGKGGGLKASAAYMIWTGMATRWIYRDGWDECSGLDGRVNEGEMMSPGLWWSNPGVVYYQLGSKAMSVP